MSMWLQDVPQDIAVTVARRCYPVAGLRMVKDTKIIAATAEAAYLYGYDRPEDFVGTYMSQARSLKDERIGQQYSCARHYGHHAAKDYAALIRHPDGREVLVRKSTIQLEGKTGLPTWVTFLEETSEGEPAKAPNLESLGITQAQQDDWSGVVSVAQLLASEQRHGNLPAIIPEKLREIVVQCGGVVKLLSGDIRFSTADGTWQHRQTCPKCSWEWFSSAEDPTQCPIRACANDRRAGRRTRARRGTVETRGT